MYFAIHIAAVRDEPLWVENTGSFTKGPHWSSLGHQETLDV
jgi:hypothetical protein